MFRSIPLTNNFTYHASIGIASHRNSSRSRSTACRFWFCNLCSGAASPLARGSREQMSTTSLERATSTFGPHLHLPCSSQFLQSSVLYFSRYSSIYRCLSASLLNLLFLGHTLEQVISACLLYFKLGIILFTNVLYPRYRI